MDDTVFELVAEFGSALVRAVGAALAAVAGALVELNGIETLGSGERMIGLWMAVLGGVLLITGYVLARDAIGLFRRPAK
jgi:branched-subunit amino acid ABC-type transport system permease component